MLPKKGTRKIKIIILSVTLICLLTLFFFIKYGYLIFLRNPKSMTVEKLGFQVTDEKHKEKVSRVGESFLTGFNTMLKHSDLDDVTAECDQFPPFYRPFCYEGSAMGFPLKALFSFQYSGSDFETVTSSMNKNYLYLYYCGLGFWYGVRFKKNVAKIEKCIHHLHPVYRYLCYDGFGFKLGFDDYVEDPTVIEKCLECEGYGKHACFQGLGRSLWFVYMDAPERLFSLIGELEEKFRGDCYAGLGLAVAFTNIDNLNFPFDFAVRIEDRYKIGYYQGLTWAFVARHMNDNVYFADQMKGLTEERRRMILQSMEACDQCFEQVDSYQTWRECTMDRIREEAIFETEM